MHDSQRMGEIPCPPRPVPRTPAVFSSSPRILRPGSRQIGLVQCQSGRQTRTHRTRSAGPRSQPLPTPVPGTPHCDAGSGRPAIDRVSVLLLPPTKGMEMHAPAAWQAAAAGVFFAAVHQAHRPNGLVAKLNSIHSYKPHGSGLVGSSWGDQYIHTILWAALV